MTASLALCAGTLDSRADHFHSLPFDEKAGHMHYLIVDQAGATVLTVRARAEYGTLALRARDIADRMNRAVDNQRQHGNLYFEIEWSHGRGTIYQVSRDGMVHFMIAAVTSGDVEGTRRREGVGDPLELARIWLDRIEAAIEAAQEVEATQGAEGTQGTESAQGHGQAEGEERGPSTHAGPPASAPPRRGQGGRPITTGISLSVTPPDAAVYLDDSIQPLPTPDETVQPSRGPLLIRVAPGLHAVEAVRPGCRHFRQEVEVRQGQVVSLDVRLEPEGGEPIEQ